MGTGYSRNDTSNNIDDGKIIDAADLDGEFDAIVSAFNSSTGHTHDGTSSEGAPIEVTGPAQEYLFDATAIYPKTDNTYDLGKVGAEFKDLYIDGTANIDSLVADAGTVGGVAIVSLSATQTLTNKTINSASNTLTVNSSQATVVLDSATATLTVDLGEATVTGTLAEFNTALQGDSFVSLTGTETLTNKTLTSPVVNGGTISGGDIDNADIGRTTPADGTFINLTTSGNSIHSTLRASETIVTKYVEEKDVLSGTTPTVNLDLANIFSLSTTGNTTFTFSNPPASGDAQRFTIRVTAGGTHTLTWPATVLWPGGTKPSDPSSGTTNIYSFFTDDGGTTYYGFLLGADMS